MGAQGGLGVLYAGLGLGGCLSTLLFLYNGYVAVTFFLEPSKDKPSNIALGVWVSSLLSVVLGPCLGGMLALVTFGVARWEQARIYNEESSIRSTTPCEIASMNALLVLVMNVLFAILLIANFI